MKKLFFIFFVLLFSTNVHAVVFEKCYAAKYNDKVIYKSFPKDKFEKYEFQVYSEGKIRVNFIFTDENLATLTKQANERRKKEKQKSGIDIGPSTTEKINTKIYTITFIDEKFIKAERIYKDKWSIYKRKINLDLTNGSILRTTITEYDGRTISRDTILYQCNLSKSSSKSNYLDYWWAVILIIAITFFIFTQSGQRLKKIRRK